jgi:hypothetical protein
LAFFVLQLRAVFHEAETGDGALYQGCAGQAWMDFGHVGVAAQLTRRRSSTSAPICASVRDLRAEAQTAHAAAPSVVGIVARLLSCCRGAHSVPLILHLPRLLVALACDFTARFDHERQDLDRFSHPDGNRGVSLISATSTADQGPDRTLAYHGVAHRTHYRDDVLLAR